MMSNFYFTSLTPVLIKTINCTLIFLQVYSVFINFNVKITCSYHKLSTLLLSFIYLHQGAIFAPEMKV